MSEYFVVANSFAAPFFSVTSQGFVEGETPKKALRAFAANYDRPRGLYAAMLYASADAYHKGAEPLVKWMSNHAKALEAAKAGKDACSIFCHKPGKFEVDGVGHVVVDPCGGSITG